MLWPHPWMKIAPPPWELSVRPKPSMLAGLQEKLLGYGLGTSSSVERPLLRVHSAVDPWSRVAFAGKPISNVGSYGSEQLPLLTVVLPPHKSTPLESTVTAAPASAPISDGSCNISARLPLSSALHPITASSGSRSTCAL